MAYPGTDNLGVYPVPPPGLDMPPGGIPDPAPSSDAPPGGVQDATTPTPDSLRASFRSVQDVNPDEHGKVIRLSRETGVPPEIVAADPGAAERARVPRQLELLPSHAPAVAAHVQDPANMAAAKDDTGSLLSLEWSLTNGRQLGVFESASEAFKTAAAQIRLGFAKTRDALGISPSTSRAIFGVDLQALAEVAREDTGKVPTAEDVARRRQQMDAVRAAEEVHAKGVLAQVWTGTFSAGPYLLGNFAAATAGGPFAALGFNTAAVYGENVETIGKVEGPAGEKLSSGAQKAVAGAVSVGEGLIYTVGLGRVVGRVAKPLAQKIPGQILAKTLASQTIPKILGKFVLRFGVAEAEGAATMAAASALEVAGHEYARTRVDPGHDFDTTPIADRAVEAFEQGLVDFALISAIGGGRRLARDIGISRASAREARALEEAAKAVQESKLAARDPAAVEGIIDQAAPGQSVLVDRKVWDEYWGGKRIDPRRKAIEIAGDDGRAYDGSNGSEFLALPLGQYLARFEKSEHILALAADAKLTPEARTPREEGKFLLEQAKRDAEARAARGKQFDVEKAEVSKVVREQAVEAGVAAEEAAAVGELVAESAGSVAIRTGLTVNEATVLMGTGRFRFLGAKATEVAQAAHEKLMQGLSPAARAEIEAARRGDRRAQMRLEAGNYVDPLTGTLNQRAFLDYTRMRSPEGWDVSIDVNNQNIQDLIGGHAVGDKMLQTVAQAMREAHDATGNVGSLYRRGGDEFHAGGMKEAEARKYAAALADRLKAQPEIVKGFRVSVSIGVGPDVHAADAAAYVSKEKKTAAFGTYAKGQPITPEALAKLGAAESFVEVRTEKGAPKGEVPIAKIGAQPVTVKLEQAGRRALPRAGVPVDETPRGAKIPSVDFGARDLHDSTERVDDASVLRDYGPKSGMAVVYRSVFPIEDLSPRLAGGVEAYDWTELYHGRGTPPAPKIRIARNGRVQIVDGNHRIQFWSDRGYTYVPAWVIDERLTVATALEQAGRVPPPAIRRVTDAEYRSIGADLRAKYPEIDFSLSGGAGGVLVLSKLVARERGKGLGSAFMRDLVAEADRLGITLAATPSTDFGGAKSRIVEFNKRFGFVQNKGRTRNLEISETMYRRPASATLEQAGAQGPRGLVRMQIDALGKPVDFPVQLLAGDASTAFHELGHFLSWAMHDVAADPRGAATRADYTVLVKWAGYASPEERLHANLERAQLEAKAMPTAEESSRLKSLRAKEEAIGHGFEQYLAEGVAPSRALERTFATLREWMLRVYRGLFGIAEQYRTHYGQDLQVSDEIRGVFDRWLAAEQGVGRVEAEKGLSEATGVLLGVLDPKDRETLLRADEDSRNAATAETYQTLKQSEVGPKESLRKKLREEVAAEVADEPVRKLETYLTSDKRPEAGILSVATGSLDPSLLDEHGKPFRLDRRLLVEDYGANVVKDLPRGATVTKGGVDAEFLSERFGFDSPEAMIQALRTAGDREAVVEARLSERIRDLYPAAAENPAAVVQAAVEAEHSPKAAEAALEAARILVREVDPSLGLRLKVMADPEIRKATAKQLVDEMRIADVQPERFLAAERKYAKEALELTAKALGKNEERAKEYAAQAMDARDKQLLNMEEYRLARDARAEMRKGAAYMDSLTRDEKRREIGKATSSETDAEGKVWVTQPYLDRVDDLTGSIGFRGSSGRTKRAERFAAWLETQPADAREDIMSRVSPSLVTSLDKTRHWTDLTVQEMRDLVAAAETIEAQARLKSKLRTTQGERDKERFVDQIVSEIGKRFPQGGGVARFERAQPLSRRALQAARKGKATLAPPEELYRELGPAMSQVFQALSDAEVQANRYMREVGLPIVKQIESLSRKERALLHATFEVDGERFTGESIIVIALNWANESNRSKLVRGESTLSGSKYKLARPISAETFQKALSHLSPKGVELVNTILRQVGEAKWDEIAALEKEFTGLAPPKIEASPYEITLSDGTKARVEGGYYPAAYDPRFSDAGQRAGEQVSQGVGALAFAPSYERTSTPQGHLQARIESYARPIDLSLSALPRAIVNHMRDLAMRRALVQTREILTDSRVRDAVQEAMGVDAYNVLTQHWRDTANEYAAPGGQPDYLLRWSQRRRAAVTGAVFAGNVGQAIQNFANIGPALDAVPATLLAKAFGRFSVERMEMADRIFAESPYMAERFQKPGTKGAIQRAAADLAGRVGKVASVSEQIRDAGMWMMETTDMVTALPLYEAAKEVAMRPKGEGARGLPESGPRATGLGMNEREAIAHAEQTVRLALGSYRWMDRSAFARQTVLKHFTMFWGFMNAQLGRFMAAHADQRLLADEGFKREALRRVVKSYAFLLASGVAADLLVGKGPQDYDGDGEIDAADWGRWTAMRAALYPPSTLPIVGSYLQQIGGKGPTRDPSTLPVQRTLQSALQVVQHTQKAMEPGSTNDEAWKAGLAALETVGWYYGLPVVQTRRTGDYWFDITPDGVQLSQEAQQSMSPVRDVFGTAFGPTRPGRLGEAFFGGQ